LEAESLHYICYQAPAIWLIAEMRGGGWNQGLDCRRFHWGDRYGLAYLDVPLLGQPEVFIHFKEGFFDANGGIADVGTQKFLQGFIDRYATWVDTILK
jgi:hypothetical protein